MTRHPLFPIQHPSALPYTNNAHPLGALSGLLLLDEVLRGKVFAICVLTKSSIMFTFVGLALVVGLPDKKISHGG